jgi:hypothetical protein
VNLCRRSELKNRKHQLLDDEYTKSFPAIFGCTYCVSCPSDGIEYSDEFAYREAKIISAFIDKCIGGEAEMSSSDVDAAEVKRFCHLSTPLMPIIQEISYWTQGNRIDPSLSLPPNVSSVIRRGILDYFGARNGAKAAFKRLRDIRDDAKRKAESPGGSI